VASAIFGIPLAIWLEKRFGNGSSLLTYTFGVGLPEELAKALPVFVLLVVLANGKQYSTRMFMYMGAVSGLAFGAVEAVKYSPGYAQGLVQGQATGLLAAEVFWRLLTDGLFHAATAAITCYFIGLAVKNRRWRNQLIGFGLAITTVLHGVNDRYSDGWMQVAVAATILFIFIGYVLTGDAIESQVQQVNQQHSVPHA
jgi:RsiW-degrading membrane proteinase PrsW (M82 family)